MIQLVLPDAAVKTGPHHLYDSRKLRQQNLSASDSCVPATPVFVTRSEPARSTLVGCLLRMPHHVCFKSQISHNFAESRDRADQTSVAIDRPEMQLQAA